MNDHLNVLNLLESKLSSLMELVKSLDAIKAEPSTVNGNNSTNNPDLLYSQVSLTIPHPPAPITKPNNNQVKTHQSTRLR